MPRYSTIQDPNIIDNEECAKFETSIWGATSLAEEKVPNFGTEMKKHFLLGKDEKNKDVAFCNHGSYGATPQYVLEKRFDLLREIEYNPDLWYRSEMLRRELMSTKRLSKFVGATSSSDLLYVDNVTEAMNIILKVPKICKIKITITFLCKVFFYMSPSLYINNNFTATFISH